ncbi:hypothetical protein N7530_000308 [Penicillium desertorum]|uniref:Uncharacterized protein n=1 Tax=Penicillium desertorum TaxID=1303715 RepID=A0A9W9X7W3_9EURO|nr:hypothetical protein N7530_000308 [Penicillium desertorum]
MQTKGGKEDPKAKLLESPKEQEAAFRKYCLDLLEDRSPDNLYYPFNKLEKRLRIYYEVRAWNELH